MRLIVLGGHGFIGSHFVRHAVDAGHDVTVVDLAPTPRHSHGRRYSFVHGGVSDLAAIPNLLRDADVLCHFAYSTVPATANADPARDVEENVVSLLHLLDRVTSTALRRIVYISSGGAVYGPTHATPILETLPLHPISAYGVSKVASEQYLRLYAANHGLRPAIIRPSNPYGIDQGKVGLLGAVTTFMNLLASGGRARIWGDGSVVRDFVHIDDLCCLLLMAAEQDVAGTYNCGSGAGCSLTQLLATIADVTGLALPVDYEPGRPFDPPAVVLDIARARAAFGWEPKVALADGIRALARDLGLPVGG